MAVKSRLSRRSLWISALCLGFIFFQSKVSAEGFSLPEDPLKPEIGTLLNDGPTGPLTPPQSTSAPAENIIMTDPSNISAPIPPSNPSETSTPLPEYGTASFDTRQLAIRLDHYSNLAVQGVAIVAQLCHLIQGELVTYRTALGSIYGPFCFKKDKIGSEVFLPSALQKYLNDNYCKVKALISALMVFQPYYSMLVAPKPTQGASVPRPLTPDEILEAAGFSAPKDIKC